MTPSWFNSSMAVSSSIIMFPVEASFPFLKLALAQFSNPLSLSHSQIDAKERQISIPKNHSVAPLF